MSLKIVKRRKVDQSEGVILLDKVQPENLSNKRDVVLNLLRREFEDDTLEVNHNTDGAPFIEKVPAIELSVSHSEPWFAVYFSKKQAVGIDIQKRRTGLFPGRYYFVNQEEERRIEMSDRNLLLIWSAKEAVYKRFKGKLERYKEGMTVIAINETELVMEVEGESLDCAYEETPEYVLVYTL